MFAQTDASTFTAVRDLGLPAVMCLILLGAMLYSIRWATSFAEKVFAPILPALHKIPSILERVEEYLDNDPAKRLAEAIQQQNQVILSLQRALETHVSEMRQLLFQNRKEEK